MDVARLIYSWIHGSRIEWGGNVEGVIIIISVFDTRRSVETIETIIRDFLKQ